MRKKRGSGKKSAKRSVKLTVKQSAKQSYSPELKVVGIIVLFLGVLFAYDFVLNPGGAINTVSEVTGNVVADVQEVVEVIQKPEPEPQPPKITTVKIISPIEGSVQTPPFTVKAELPLGAAMCYYLIKDNGQVKWDRRTVSCNGIVKKGKDTCYVLYSAAARDGSALGTDEVYFSIE